MNLMSKSNIVILNARKKWFRKVSMIPNSSKRDRFPMKITKVMLMKIWKNAFYLRSQELNGKKLPFEPMCGVAPETS